ncbi:MAG: von Willebrand factor type A domain-containing protein [Bacteroidia bacterium]
MKSLLLFLLSCVVFSTTAFSQSLLVSGTVYSSEDMSPLIGVAVVIKGTARGVLTDMDGKFTISCGLNDVLEVSYMGFVRQEIPVNGRTEINIHLVPDHALLEEVVVAGAEKENRRREEMSKVQINHLMLSEKQNAAAAFSPKPVAPQSYHDEWGGEAGDADDFNREGYDRIYENPFRQVSNDPLSTFSIDVDRASYANVRRFIQDGTLPPPDAVRIEEMINYFDYQYPQPEGEHPFAVQTTLTSCPWSKDHHLVHIGLKGREIPASQIPPANLVFLLDVSGSMNNYDKLPLLKEAMSMLVDQLRREDRVAIVVYAGAAGLVLPSTPGTQKSAIKAALGKLSAGGSTAGGEGIELAYKIAREQFLPEGNNRVILATDGDFNVGVSDDGALTRLIEKERDSGVFLTVLGFGTGNYQDAKMEKLADHGNGNYAYIDQILEAEKVLVREMSGTLYTIAKDVKLQIEFNPAKVQAYRLVGYENRMLNTEDFKDDKKDAGEMGAGHTVTAIYEVIPVGVKSSFIKEIDPLKYQSSSAVVASSAEWLTVKIRYKNPGESISIYLDQPLKGKVRDWENAPEDVQFSLAVAEWGLLLRNSEFKQEASYKALTARAQAAKGADINGDRAEFIRLVKTAALMGGR